jgi:hypothetical protein
VGYTGFRWGNVRGRGLLGDPGVDGRIIVKWILRKWDVEVWTGSSWLRIGTGGGYLRLLHHDTTWIAQGLINLLAPEFYI